MKILAGTHHSWSSIGLPHCQRTGWGVNLSHFNSLYVEHLCTLSTSLFYFYFPRIWQCLLAEVNEIKHRKKEQVLSVKRSKPCAGWLFTNKQGSSPQSNSFWSSHVHSTKGLQKVILFLNCGDLLLIHKIKNFKWCTTTTTKTNSILLPTWSPNSTHRQLKSTVFIDYFI